MKKKLTILATALLAVGVLSACAAKNEPSSETKKEATQENAEVKEITITAQNMMFEPKEVTVEKGTKVKLTFKNNEDQANNLVVEGTDMAIDKVEPKQEQTIEFVADRAGEFTMKSTLSGMDSMSAKLIVK